MMCHGLDISSVLPIRSTTQIRVATLHYHYEIFAPVPQASLCRETSGGITKCQLFSQANNYVLVEKLPWLKNWEIKNEVLTKGKIEQQDIFWHHAE